MWSIIKEEANVNENFYKVACNVSYHLLFISI
jgi:hypothetical protein